MEYNIDKKEIIINRKLNELDKFVIEFVEIVRKYMDYIIISGYISILLGRSRATEDIDIFIKKIPLEKFSEFYEDIKNKGFWCLNAEDVNEIYEYLDNNMAVRFARVNQSIPNFELKYPARVIDSETFDDFLIAILPMGRLKISSLERQIAFKRYYLMSEKDLEDAVHIEEIFKEKLNKEKINKLKNQLEKI